MTASILPDSPVPGQASRTATLRVFVRISDHADGVRFYGTIPAVFQDVDLASGAKEQTVWEDTGCHGERGRPKISVPAIEGSIREGNEAKPVAAMMRVRGLRLPPDEITERKSAGAPVAPVIAAIEAETGATRLRINIRLLAWHCRL